MREKEREGGRWRKMERGRIKGKKERGEGREERWEWKLGIFFEKELLHLKW